MPSFKNMRYFTNKKHKSYNMKEFWHKSYPHFIAILIFIALSAVYFSPQLNGYLIKQHDIEQFLGMSKEIVDFRETYHEEPLWTDATFSGMPAYQISIKNGNLINSIKGFVLKLIPRPIGYFVFLMAGFYILLLCFNVSPWIAIIGGIAFGFSSLNLLYLGAGHNAKIHALSFIPPIIGSIIYAYRKNRWIGAALLSVFVCLHLTANHIQLTYYLIYLILAIIVVELYNHVKEKKIDNFIKVSVILIIAGVLGTLPTLTNLYTTNEYSKYTTRGKSELTIPIVDNGEDKADNDALDKDYIKQYSLGKGEIWSVVIPNIKGGRSGYIGQYKDITKDIAPAFRNSIAQSSSYWGEQLGSGGAFYFGAAVFALFVLGMFFIRDRIKWAFLAASLLAFVLSWKYGVLVDFFIKNVPLFNKFRDTKMMLIIAQISFPLLAILFIQYLLNNEIDKKKFLYVSLGISGLFFLFYVAPKLWFDFFSKAEAAQIEQQYTGMANNPAGLSQFESYINELESARIAIFKKDCIRSLFIIIMSLALIYLYINKKIKKNVLLIALGLIILVDIWSVSKRYLNNEKRGSQYYSWVDSYSYNNPFNVSKANMSIAQKEFSNNPGLRLKIENELSSIKNTKKLKPVEFNEEKMKIMFEELNFATNYRVLNLQNPFAEARTSYFHKSLGGYHGAKLRNYNEVINLYLSREVYFISTFLEKVSQTQVITELPKLKIPVVNMLNTKYIINSLNENAIENPYCFGKAWFVKNIQIVPSSDDEIMALAEIDKNTAYVNSKFADKIETNIEYDSLATVEQTMFKPNQLKYTTNCSTEQFLVFSEIYYDDGWNVYIDDKPAEYVRANYILRAMNIPEGKHIIEFKFEPGSYYLGRKLSNIGSVLILLFIAGMIFVNYRKK